MPTKLLEGALYFDTFIVDATHKLWEYPMACKDDALTLFHMFLALIQNQSRKKLKWSRTDNDGEYVSGEFGTF